ncbi:MAG: hypothetical protein GC136_09420 [Alphaproteobacteria bacterium]|nr:hypothetical protein [Alphaproteobacteria bacterium]
MEQSLSTQELLRSFSLTQDCTIAELREAFRKNLKLAALIQKADDQTLRKIIAAYECLRQNHPQNDIQYTNDPLIDTALEVNDIFENIHFSGEIGPLKNIFEKRIANIIKDKLFTIASFYPEAAEKLAELESLIHQPQSTKSRDATASLAAAALAAAILKPLVEKDLVEIGLNKFEEIRTQGFSVHMATDNSSPAAVNNVLKKNLS